MPQWIQHQIEIFKLKMEVIRIDKIATENDRIIDRARIHLATPFDLLGGLGLNFSDD